MADAELNPDKHWLLLIHQLPAKPAYVRVKLWRRLQALGAVAVKNAVHALPATEQSQEDFEWLLKEIVEGGGEAMICEARLIDGLSDSEVEALFNAARDHKYGVIAAEARALSKKLSTAASMEARAEFKSQFTRLKNRHSQTIAIDFFDANGRQAADGLIGALEKAFSETHGEQGGGRDQVTERQRNSQRPHMDHAYRRACGPHRLRVADPQIHRPQSDFQISSAQGLQTGTERIALRYVRSGVHP